MMCMKQGIMLVEPSFKSGEIFSVEASDMAFGLGFYLSRDLFLKSSLVDTKDID